ncbi:hypothetical protein BDZ97DRAFT_1914417 [Flammula alnicola]|nr:hypothetical protein BDZ97DRAFT_1914417 [Flammula alnicola]
MEEDFAQGTTPLGALRGILGNYPYSVGLFRELLQNSDDAGAAKQVFVLDRRTHSTTSLYHPKLASTQGPALLAYNDAKFNAYDWHALKFAYESSKADDSSKIGKYGVGFRSVFHITDCPQIVSGNVFAMFDPLQAFTDSAGKRLNLSHRYHHPLPLRHTASKISSKVVGPHDIDHLFHEFIYEEIEISLLFLQNIQHIEIHDINERGVSKCMPSFPSPDLHRSGVEITTQLTPQLSPSTTSTRLKIKRSSGDITRILKEHKLLPNIGIATPLDPTSEELTSGRLFTFLPLPLPTGFPVHLHAYFALTQSRQNLRNSREIGLVPGTDDYILIEWNKLLFDHYIPQAWKLFLEVLADMDGIFDIFKAWPPEQRSPATSGENVYWESLPARMFEFIASASSPIWPVYHGNNSSPPEFRPLDSLIVSEPTIPRSVLHALTAVRLRFTCPPQYVVDLIKNSRFKTFAILTPEEAHNGLLVYMLRNASKEDISVILQYLLSTQNVLNLVDLPIITAASGQIIALSPASANTSVTYTLLVRTEFDVFGSCDDNAIPLHLLPLKVADTLRIHGPGSLNVETLAVPRIIDYLTIYPNRLGLDLSLVRNDPLAVKWLSNSPPLLTSFIARPANSRDAIVQVSWGTSGFCSTPVILGVPFLDADLSEIAQGILALYGLLKSISDIHTLLDLLPSTPTGLQALSKDACVSILKHLSSRASGSCIMHGPFNEEQIRRLRNLPIFPVVHFPFSDRTPSTIATEWTRLPDGLALKSVANPSFLPSIGGVVFVQLSSIAPDILQYLEPSNPVHLSDVQLLSLTVDHFVDQPDHIQAAALRYISQHRLRIPPYILETVRQAEFVAVQDGTRRMPMDVVDPDSPIAPLYQASLAHQVRRETLSDQVIVQALQSLELMQRSLTIQMAQERIDAIASDPHSLNSVELSRLLLSLMGRAHLEYSQLTMSPEQRWLPTTEGLRGPGECRDGTRFSPHLFDRVLAVLEPFNIPYSLRQALGWDRPLSTEVLIQQLDRVLQSSEDVFSVVLDIMKELGSRSCGDVELSSLRSVTHDRKWVPTTDRQLSHSMNAIFSQPMTESGFYQIYPIDQRTQDFLRRMGCTDRPTTDAILFKLQAAREQPPSLNILLVPDVTNTLRPFSETFFNDIGDQARLIPSENNFISHHLLDESLARKLNLGRLGLKYVGLSIPGVDMGEKPVITVRKNLGQYTEKQFVTEFLANASDANATEFSLLVNDFHPDPSEDIQALSPVMAKFCVSPSLSSITSNVCGRGF